MAGDAKIVAQRLRPLWRSARITAVAGALQRHALRKAAAALGGEMLLCEYLDVPSLCLFRWLHGRAPVPDHVMHEVISLLADIEAGLVGSADQTAPAAKRGLTR